MSQKTFNKYIAKGRRLLARLQAEANFKGIYENFGQREVGTFLYDMDRQDDLTYSEKAQVSKTLERVADIVPQRKNPVGDVLRETKGYIATSSKRGIKITTKEKGAYPKSRVIPISVWKQIWDMSDSSFDGSIALELGIGSFYKNPAGSVATEFRLYTYDVWGNAQDGYEVNDVSRTSEIYKLFEDYTDRELLEALQEQGAIPKAGIELDLIEIEGDFDSALAFYYNSRPEFELRKEL